MHEIPALLAASTRTVVACEVVWWGALQVLRSVPAVGLPWPAGKLQRVAAPQAARPQQDMPLVSGSMRILDGECRLLHAQLYNTLVLE